MSWSLSDLWVFWHGEESRGVFAYCLASRVADLPSEFYDSVAVEFTDLIPIEDWVVWRGVVHIGEKSTVNEILEDFERLSGQLLASGGIVFWIGGEDCSWNPGILNPSNSFGNVLGVAVEGSGLLLSRSEGQFDLIADDVLRVVWELVTSRGVPPDLGGE